MCLFWFERAARYECTICDVERLLIVAEMALRENGEPLDISQREAVRFVIERALAEIRAGDAAEENP